MSNKNILETLKEQIALLKDSDINEIYFQSEIGIGREKLDYLKAKKLVLEKDLTTQNLEEIDLTMYSIIHIGNYIVRIYPGKNDNKNIRIYPFEYNSYSVKIYEEKNKLHKQLSLSNEMFECIKIKDEANMSKEDIVKILKVLQFMFQVGGSKYL